MSTSEEVEAYLENAKGLRLDLIREKESLASLEKLMRGSLRDLCAGSAVMVRLDGDIERGRERIAAIEEEMAGVEATFSKLPPVEADVLRMRYLEGKRWQEIANRVFFCLGYVSGDVHRRSKEHLREYI